MYVIKNGQHFPQPDINQPSTQLYQRS